MCACADEALAQAFQVSAEVYERGPGSRLVRMALPYASARDAAGRRFIADSRGMLFLAGASGDITVSLDSPFFRIRADFRDMRESELVIPASRVALTREAIFGDAHAPLSARMCRAHLDRAREAVLEAMPEAVAVPWFSSQVTCYYAFDEGCNAAWDGRTLMFHEGDHRCAPAAHLADMIYHEYGHGVFEHLATQAGFDSIVTEGVADFFTSTLTGDGRFSPGFWFGRDITWLRDLSRPSRFPEDAKGIYTAASVVSSAWYAVMQRLTATAPERTTELWVSVRGAFLRSLSRMQRGDSQWGSNLIASARAAIEAIGEDPVLGQENGAACLASRVFAEHGLAGPKPECARLTVTVVPMAAETPRDAAVLVRVRNAGPLVRAATLRVGSREIDLGDFAPGAVMERRVSLPGAKCGEIQPLEVTAYSPLEGWLGEAVSQARHGWSGTAKGVSLNLLRKAGVSRLLIPDAIPDPALPSAALAPGAWAVLPVSLRLAAGERVMRAVLNADIDHPFADDVVLGVRFGGGAVAEFYKGEEERTIPSSYFIEAFTGASGELNAAVLARDIGTMFEGEILAADLSFDIGRFACP